MTLLVWNILTVVWIPLFTCFCDETLWLLFCSVASLWWRTLFLFSAPISDDMTLLFSAAPACDFRQTRWEYFYINVQPVHSMKTRSDLTVCSSPSSDGERPRAVPVIVWQTHREISFMRLAALPQTLQCRWSRSAPPGGFGSVCVMTLLIFSNNMVQRGQFQRN